MGDTQSLISHIQSRGLARGESGEFKPRSDLTFRVFERIDVKDADAYQSLLNGSLFRECSFEHVRFARCDFEQVQFQSCRFRGVSFLNVEFTSGQVGGSRFEDCDFRSALICESVFSACTFTRCSFTQSVIRSSRFDDCIIAAANLRGASIQLNAFKRTQFEDTKLANCTFLNAILSKCIYRNVHINAESIGSLFGLTENDLATIRLIYLGRDFAHDLHGEALLSALGEEYEKRRWAFMHAVLRLNFGKVARVTGLNACLSALLWPAKLGAPLKATDIAFLEMIVLDLSSQERMPVLCMLLIPDAIQKFLANVRAEVIGQSSALVLQQLASRLNMLLLEQIDRFSEESILTESKDRPLQARLVFRNRPATDVVKFMNEVAKASGLTIDSETVTLREEAGSYILYVQTTLITLGALQTALWLLNGCAAQIIELKSRLQIITRKRPPKIIHERVLLPQQTTPRWITAVIQGIVGKLTGKPTSLDRVAADLGQDNLERVETGIQHTDAMVKKPQKPRQAKRDSR